VGSGRDPDLCFLTEGNCFDVVTVADLLIGGMPWYTSTSEVRQYPLFVTWSGFAGIVLSL
jgi:hypothetical protein